MKAQQLVQCMVPRALFEGVQNTSKSVYSSDSQLLLSGLTAPTTRVSVILFPVNSSCCLLKKKLHQLYCFQCVAGVCVFFLAIESTQNNYSVIESVHPTDSVVFRTCRLVVSRSFGESQSYILDRFCRQILMNRLYISLVVEVLHRRVLYRIS